MSSAAIGAYTNFTFFFGLVQHLGSQSDLLHRSQLQNAFCGGCRPTVWRVGSRSFLRSEPCICRIVGALAAQFYSESWRKTGRIRLHLTTIKFISMQLNRIILYLMLALSLASCRKDTDDISLRDITYQPPVVRVNGKLTGQVVDAEGNPVANAQVRVGQQTAQTNELGLFFFNDIALNAAGTFIQAQASGYFPGSTRFFPRPNASNIVRIGLIPRTYADQISATSGGTVSLSNGAKVTLPANGIVDAAGNNYSGSVQVAMFWINPDADNLHDLMPGNLQGVDRNNREVSMATWGMMAVELFSPDGQKLQIKPGEKAVLTFPLPAAYRAQAPGSMPLWYFDETLGLWIEEGQARLQGNTYVGEVGHFSFWNVDAPFPLIDITGVININGQPAGSTLVVIRVDGLNSVGSGFTNTEGVFAGKVPKNQVLTVQVMSACNNVVASINIGPFADNTDVGTLNFSLTGPTNSVVSGQLLNCDGEPVTEGAVYISWSGNQQFIAVGDDGQFSVTLQHCGATSYTLWAVDFENQYIADEEIYTFTNSPQDLGDIEVCDTPFVGFMQLTAFNQMEFNLNLVTVTSDEFSFDSLAAPQLFYRIQGLSNPGNTADLFALNLRAPLVPGTYTGQALFADGYLSNLINTQGPLTVSCAYPCQDITVIITEAGPNSGDVISGTFSGVVTGFGSGAVFEFPVSGSFSVLRP